MSRKKSPSRSVGLVCQHALPSSNSRIRSALKTICLGAAVQRGRFSDHELSVQKHTAAHTSRPEAAHAESNRSRCITQHWQESKLSVFRFPSHYNKLRKMESPSTRMQGPP